MEGERGMRRKGKGRREGREESDGSPKILKIDPDKCRTNTSSLY